MDTVRNLALVTAAAALSAVTLVASPALGHSGDDGDDDDRETIRTGQCTGRTDWKLKAKSDDGGIEVEAEIDSNRAGQAWRWVVRHNGTVSARGTSMTTGRSGSFDVERHMTDLSGTDLFVLRATNPESGERCRGVLSW
jgi:hypothetical protein